jgi:hypothetical protein
MGTLLLIDSVLQGRRSCFLFGMYGIRVSAWQRFLCFLSTPPGRSWVTSSAEFRDEADEGSAAYGNYHIYGPEAHCCVRSPPLNHAYTFCLLFSNLKFVFICNPTILIAYDEELLRSYSLCGFMHPLVTSCLFGEHSVLEHGLCSCLNVRGDEASHPRRITRKL